MDGYEAGESRESSPTLPPINMRFDSPGSDYMSAFRGQQKDYLISTASAKSKCSKHNSTAKTCSRNHEGSDLSGSKPPNDIHPRRNRFIRDHTVPAVKSGINNQGLNTRKSHSDIAYEQIKPIRLSIPNSASTYKSRSAKSCDRQLTAWIPPVVTSEKYEESKERLLKGGKFREQMVDYFGLRKNWWEEKSDSEDDGYDTDLDKQLGFDLIADEQAREILKDGAFPEYKQECRKFRSNPNSYFLRNALNDEIMMRHRYLSKPDSMTISKLIKNDLTFRTLDLDDNGIGPHGMKYFKNVLDENKHLTEMSLAFNKLGPVGAKHLRASLVGNCFLLKIDISENNFGDKGAKYIAGIIEDNVTLKELNIAGNDIGDRGAMLIAKALGNNVSLKVLDVGWNNIRTVGAVSLCNALKKNTELEVFLAPMNGFAGEGGRAMVTALRQNNILKEVDLSSNRLTDSVLKYLTFSWQEMTNLAILNLGNSCFTLKPVLDFLTLVMANPGAVKELDFEGVDVTDDFKALCKALHVVHNVGVFYCEPPSKREITKDILTKNLKLLCEFMEAQEIEVEDLYPDYEEVEEEEQVMVTVKEVLCALEFSGKVSNVDGLQRLKSRLRYGRKRKFLVSELAVVYDTVLCGKDPLKEQPLRTHLRRSITEERAEKERRAKQKKSKRSLFS